MYILHSQPYILQGIDKENLYNNQEVLQSVIISFILITLALYTLRLISNQFIQDVSPHIKVMRIKEMITNLKSSWLLNKFSSLAT